MSRRVEEDWQPAEGGVPRVAPPARAPVFAAIDLGTNNCRLLVAEPSPEGFRVVDAFSRIVRLGEGVTRCGEMSEPAMARTIEALRICAAKLRRREVTHLRAVATEACRKARNAPAFLERVARRTGIELEIISEDEEARLALMGCAPLLDCKIPTALVFDIGGGSTEVSWMTVPRGGCDQRGRHLPELRGWHSVPIGVGCLAERYGGRSITAASYNAMVREVEIALAPFEVEHRVADALAAGLVQMMGTSGTVTTLAGVYQDLPRYDRKRVDGCYLDFETVEAVSRRIASMSYDERCEHPCIGGDRADLVIAGCAILKGLCRTWPVGRLRVADRGLREGILLQLMAGHAAEASSRDRPVVCQPGEG